jgi:hypothetical protein
MQLTASIIGWINYCLEWAICYFQSFPSQS